MEENLAAFNQDAASLAGDGEKAPAVLNACTLADGTASLLIDFSSPVAYMEFMAAYPDEESGVQVKALSILSMEEAELGDVSLTAAAGKEKGTAVPGGPGQEKIKAPCGRGRGPGAFRDRRSHPVHFRRSDADGRKRGQDPGRRRVLYNF